MSDDGSPNDHPTHDDLRRFLRGELTPVEARPVLVHLGRGCATCLAVMAPTVATMFAPAQQGPAPAVEEECYALPVGRAVATARRHAKLLAEQRRALDRKVAAGEEVKPSEMPPEEAAVCRWIYVERALEEIEESRAQLQPRVLEDAALHTALLAHELTAGPFGARAAADLQTHAWAELANAYRLQEEYGRAEGTFDTAMACFRRGSRDPRLRAWLMDLMASLCRDQRRLPEAARLLSRAGAIYQRLGEDHLAGRVFMKSCTVAHYMGEPEAALAFVSKAFRLIDTQRAPQLGMAALHNLIVCLVEVGRETEAASLLWRCRGALSTGASPVDKLRLRWLEGRIAAGTGQPRRAERIFIEVREGFTEADALYAAALAGLDLSALLLGQGRTADTYALVDEMLTTFHRLGIVREALASLLILHQALARGEATVAMVRTVATEIRRLERPVAPKSETPALEKL